MLYISADNGEEGAPGALKLLKGVKILCNAFLAYHLAQRDEIWHSDVHWCVARLEGFWWTWSTSRSKNFRTVDISHTF